MAFRFLHTADWQLGKSFANVPGDAGALLRQARLDAVRRIATLANARSCAAVLVAGDIFDTPWPDPRTLHGAIGAMRDFAGSWIMLPGNHDPVGASDLWERLQAMAEGVDLRLALEPKAMPVADGLATILPAPLTSRHGFDDATGWMDAAETPSGSFRIGLAHGSVRDFDGSQASPNLIDPGRAGRAKLDYLALGDWHGLTKIDGRTYYSGTPEPDRFADNQPGHVLIVELANGAPPRIEVEPTARYHWRQLAMTVTADGLPAVDRIEAFVRDASEPERTLLALALDGSVDLAGRATLGAAIDGWRARLCHLRLDDTRLRDAPSEADLAELAEGSGVVAATARQLAAEDSAVAALALRQLFDLARDRGA